MRLRAFCQTDPAEPQVRGLPLSGGSSGGHHPRRCRDQHRPEPFTWTADPHEIVAAVRRGHQIPSTGPCFPEAATRSRPSLPARVTGKDREICVRIEPAVSSDRQGSREAGAVTGSHLLRVLTAIQARPFAECSDHPKEGQLVLHLWRITGPCGQHHRVLDTTLLPQASCSDLVANLLIDRILVAIQVVK